VSDDFGFELVDEETQESMEAQPGRVGVFGNGGSGSGGRHSEEVVRRRRLVIGVVAGLIVLVLVIVLVTGGSGGKGGAFKSYFSRLAPIAAGSQRVGASLDRILTRVQRSQVSDPGSKLEPLVKQAQAQLVAAQALRPPTGLGTEHGQALSALAFRVSGLEGLQAALGHRGGSTSKAGLTSSMGRQIDALVTSDVVWRDLVVQPAVAAVQRLRLGGSVVPPSVFVANPELSSPQSIALLAQPHAPAAAPVLRLGSTSVAVRSWQEQLNRWLRLKHLKPVTADGAFGPGTQAATQALQRAAALTPDGVVGPATRTALAKALLVSKK
jgi:hypothetical protein